jgi:hypothetical protein
MLKFLFECKFNLFDVVCLLIIWVIYQETHSYWWYLLALPTMLVSVIMERKLEVRKILEERQRGY